MKIRVVLSALLLALAAGCTTRSETVKTPYPPVGRPTVVDKRVIIDAGIVGSVRLVGVKSSVGADGFLKVQVNVQSLLNAPHQFDYKMVWMDGDGLRLPLPDDGEMTWTFLAHETSFLSITAPSPSVRDFRLLLYATDSVH